MALIRPGRSSAATAVPPAAPGAYDAYITDVLTQVTGGPVRTYGWKKSDNSITLLDTHTHDGNSWTVDGQTISVSTKTGRLVTVTTSTINAAINDVQPGDTIQLHAGTYTGAYGPNAGYNSSQFILWRAQSGTASQPVHLTAYPGETVNITNSAGNNFFCGHFVASDTCDYWNVSAMNLTGTTDNFYSGANTGNELDPESGGRFWRIVGNLLHRTDSDNNVGQVEYGGDGLTVLANRFTNVPITTPNNQAHAIYIDSGADNCEIAYNRFELRCEGFIVMIHQDGAGMQYDNNWIHHNYFQPQAGSGRARGFSQSNVANASTCLVEDNYFDGVGDAGNFGPIMVYRGTVTAKRNTFNNCFGNFCMETDNLMGGTRHLYYGTGADANIVIGSLGLVGGTAGDFSAL